MNLEYIREEYELSQLEVAKKLGVARSSYAMWETGKDIIPIKRLNDFCNLFNVSLDFALGLSSNKNYENMKKVIDKNSIKKRVKELRTANNLTQLDLASKFQITRSLISKYETGTNLILTSVLIEYANFFNVSSDYIVGRIDVKLNLKD